MRWLGLISNSQPSLQIRKNPYQKVSWRSSLTSHQHLNSCVTCFNTPRRICKNYSQANKRKNLRQIGWIPDTLRLEPRDTQFGKALQLNFVKNKASPTLKCSGRKTLLECRLNCGQNTCRQPYTSWRHISSKGQFCSQKRSLKSYHPVQ